MKFGVYSSIANPAGGLAAAASAKRDSNGTTGATDQRGAVRGSGSDRKLRHSIGGSSTGPALK
jgi:hypothetical protein